ncbi:MAG: Hsp70 family protein [Bacteroidales bacterium]|nr:Hsp70 family protein [Bacteroidales bacterium]
MRNKIDYGIDLGTTNSAIARMENGVPTIIKADTSKDILPSCVRFTPKKTVMVGELAVSAMQTEITRALNTFDNEKMNSFIEFKRTMGTTHKYESTNMGREFSSEELSAEILKTLKSFVQDENISSIVITVPAKFTNQQTEATIQAAKLAGFKHIKLLQEPVAAATAYGLTAKDKDSYWLVFDFGGGTFDAAIIKSEKGILTVKDTDGDNWLGGKNLDEAIVDQIIIPYLQENYTLDLKNEKKKQIWRDALKRYAETAKNQISFKDKWAISVELGMLRNDDNDEEIEIDIEVTGKDIAAVLCPIFQKAIDITKNLLKRNNLKGSDLGALILVGGPTHSPILRQMLKEQITENVDTSVDPMTVVAKGAALVASTISISEEVKEESRDKTKLQLEIGYEAATVEMDTMVNIKILRDKTEGTIPEKVFADVLRGDGAWNSGKKQIGKPKGDLIDVHLLDGSNIFTVNVYDEQGNKLECQPNQFTIIGGIEPPIDTLSYNIGIVKWFDEYEEDRFAYVKGLDKNKRLPARGARNGLKTRSEIRPGMANDIISIPIYEGDYNAEGTNPLLNNWVGEVIISGESLPALLPTGSDVDITIKVDSSRQMQFSAYFPLIDHTEELKIQIKQTEPPTEEKLKRDIADAKRTAKRVNDTVIFEKLKDFENQLENEKGSADGKMKILDSLRKELLKLDEADKATLFPKIEKELKETFYELEDLVEKIKRNGDTKDLNMGKVEATLADMKQKVDVIIREKSIKEAKELIKEIGGLDFELRNAVTGNAMDLQFLQDFNQNFNSFHWINPTKARQLINQAMQQVANGNKNIRPLLVEIVQLLPRDEQAGDTLR